MLAIKEALNSASLSVDSLLKDKQYRFYIPNDMSSFLKPDLRTYVLLPPKYASLVGEKNKHHYFVLNDKLDDNSVACTCTLLSAGTPITSKSIEVPLDVVKAHTVPKGEASCDLAYRFLHTLVIYKKKSRLFYGQVTSVHWEQPTVLESLESRSSLSVVSDGGDAVNVKIATELISRVSEIIFLLKPLRNLQVVPTLSVVQRLHYELERALTRDNEVESFLQKYYSLANDTNSLLGVWNTNVSVNDHVGIPDDLVLEEIVNAERLAKDLRLWTVKDFDDKQVEISTTSSKLEICYYDEIKRSLQNNHQRSTRLLTLEEKMQHMALQAQESSSDLLISGAPSA